jgi:3-isopropylmalate dehydrogenase
MAMMLRHSFDLTAEAERVEQAVRHVLRGGYRTADIFEPGSKRVGTEAMGDLVARAVIN